jgi:hypothetical protein
VRGRDPKLDRPEPNEGMLADIAGYGSASMLEADGVTVRDAPNPDSEDSMQIARTV